LSLEETETLYAGFSADCPYASFRSLVRNKVTLLPSSKNLSTMFCSRYFIFRGQLFPGTHGSFYCSPIFSAIGCFCTLL